MRYILSIGTNTEPREERLRDALQWLVSLGESYCSTPYATAPIGRDAGNERKHYQNAVVILDYSGSESELDPLLKAYEAGAGRTPEARLRGEVPIDIDIVIAGDKIVRPKDFSRYFFRQGYEELISLGLIHGEIKDIS